MKIRSQSAFTLIEMLVVISIIAVLAAFAVPALTSALTKGQMTGTMNNGRQLYLAAQQMALDGAANADPNLGWPGDVGDATVTAYMSRLVANDYLKPGDVQKLLNGPGTNATVTAVVGPPAGVTLAGAVPALKFFKVKDNDSSNVVFIETNNYAYDTAIDVPPSSTTNPFGAKGFIVQRKGGDASILRKNNATVALSGGNQSVFQSTVGKKIGDADGTVNPEAAADLLTWP
jgi:prepilin-type N-terminal cleavage/methylation domain-containing protein